MSDECEWDPDWWMKAHAAGLERRAERANNAATANLGDTFLVVTEGTVTEPIYFDLLKRHLQVPTLRVRVIPGDSSDPRHVVATAASEAQKQIQRQQRGALKIDEPPVFDHIWAVVDTDVAVRDGFWNEVKQLAMENHVSLAHSTPCFEFWLLLHVEGYTTRADLHNGDAAKNALKEALGFSYSTNASVATRAIGSFIDKWPNAVTAAERVAHHHKSCRTRPPWNPSTELGRLVRSLNDSIPVHLQRL